MPPRASAERPLVELRDEVFDPPDRAFLVEGATTLARDHLVWLQGKELDAIATRARSSRLAGSVADDAGQAGR